MGERTMSSREPSPSSTGLGPSGFDPERVAELADLIETACVPHGGIGNDSNRTLRYYASVGIDCFNHPHERLRALFEDAARLVLAHQSERTGA